MATITLSAKLTKENEDFVAIPRKEYEEFLRSSIKIVREVSMTSAQKRVLERARKNLAQGKYLTLDELKQKLGHKNRRERL
mgnify:CR=1 FL=1